MNNIMQSPSGCPERQRPENMRGRPCGTSNTQHIPLLRISAPFAAEGYESLGVTVCTADSQKAVLQTTAPEIVIELALNMRRQRTFARR